MTNIEKIKQLEEKRAQCEEKAKKYKQRAAYIAQKIENVLNQVDMPFEDVLKMLAELTGVPIEVSRSQSSETDQDAPKA